MLDVGALPRHQRPRISTVEEISAIVAAVAPKPVNLLINAPFTTVEQAAGLGVRRISVGGTLARAAWGGWLGAAQEIAEHGGFTAFEDLPDVEALHRARLSARGRPASDRPSAVR